MSSRFSINLVLVANWLVLAGCSTPKAGRDHERSDDAPLVEALRPALLYLLPSPHSRIYVEVDAVQGCEPKEAVLQKLRDFLSACCNKFDAVEVVRSDVIPSKAARRISARALARKYMNGPGTNSTPPAYLYVLCYDDTLSRYSAITRFLHRGTQPYAETYPYPAIYLNTRFSLGLAQTEILLHEAGHVLGLTDRPTYARNGHCLNSGCQMNTHRHYLFEFRWLPGRRPTHLCDECIAELRRRSDQPAPTNLRYVGSVLVRSEGDYHVASLPDRAGVLVGNHGASDCQEFASAVRAEPTGTGNASLVYCRVKDHALEDPAKLKHVLNRVKKDPSELVRRGAPKALIEVCVGRYRALGQYSNAVEMLQQAILWDAKDAENYNHLAWIKATCPDASVRNGDEAVAAARKACELNAWKNGQRVDTLAAAYAEAGDFKRAIEFQEQALRIGTPTESEQKEMRERLSLYRQSKPFRGK